MNAPRTQKSEASSIWHLRPHWKALTQAPRAHLRPIDGLRALSILLVFAFHLVWCAQVVIRDTYVQFQQLTPWAVAQERCLWCRVFLAERFPHWTALSGIRCNKDLQFNLLCTPLLRLMRIHRDASAAIGSMFIWLSQIFEQRCRPC